MYCRTLRLDESLFRRCRLAAKAEGVTENAYIANAIANATARTAADNADLVYDYWRLNRESRNA